MNISNLATPPMPPLSVQQSAAPVPAVQNEQPKSSSQKPVQDAQTLDVVYKLNPLFKDKYVEKIKGKDFVKYAGLIVLAKAKGMKSLTVKVLQFPHADNSNTAICEATLTGWDKGPDKSVIEVTYVDIGDANATNCSSVVKAHYPRVASTRAKGRVLRDYLGIDAVMEEEILDLDTTPGSASALTPVNKSQVQAGAQPVTVQPDASVTQQQIEEVNSLVHGLGWTNEIFNGYLAQLFPTLGNNVMSGMQANYLIQQLKAQAGIF